MIGVHLDLRRRLDLLSMIARYTILNLVRRLPVTGDGAAVVSLTSYGQRIEQVFITLETIGAGDIRPQRLILWLDDEAVVESPPRRLRRLISRGLEVRLTQDFGPHKKYLPYVLAAGEYAPHSALTDPPLITADDDVLYPRSWLGGLLDAHRIEPEAVLCYRARWLQLEADATIKPYADWPLVKSTAPSLLHVATGVSGILYPPSMQRAMKAASTTYTDTAPFADDIWLHRLAVRTGTPIKQLCPSALHPRPIPLKQSGGLYASNGLGGANDRAVAATYTPEDRQALMRAKSDERTQSHELGR